MEQKTSRIKTEQKQHHLTHHSDSAHLPLKFLFWFGLFAAVVGVFLWVFCVCFVLLGGFCFCFFLVGGCFCFFVFSFYDIRIDRKGFRHAYVAPKADTKLTSHITRIASKPGEAEGSHLVDYRRLG